MAYVVDDDDGVRLSVCFMLEADGQACTPFESGEAFLGEIAQLERGCVLLDVRMPGIDGAGVLREMGKRALRWPVVVMTGHGDVDLAIEIMKLGAVEYIEKPFARPELLECLNRAGRLLNQPESL